MRLLLGRRDTNPNSPGTNSRTLLSYVAWRGDENVVKQLLDRQDVNLNPPDTNGRTLLSFPALRRHEGVLRLLLDGSNVGPNSSDNLGQTPLSYAPTGVSLENHNRMPTSVTDEITPYQEVTYPLTATDDDPTSDTWSSAWRPPQKQLIPLKRPLPD